jgi:hypothetical protein
MCTGWVGIRIGLVFMFFDFCFFLIYFILIYVCFLF